AFPSPAGASAATAATSPADHANQPRGITRRSGIVSPHEEQPERDGVSGLRGVILTVRFLCELALLAALAYWGFTVGDGVGAWALGIGAPLLSAVVWGALVAPKARWPVPIPTRVAIELVLFGAAVGALVVAGQPMLALVLGIAALVTTLLNASQERRAGGAPAALLAR